MILARIECDRLTDGGGGRRLWAEVVDGESKIGFVAGEVRVGHAACGSKVGSLIAVQAVDWCVTARSCDLELKTILKPQASRTS